MNVLVADIGATNSRLAIWTECGASLVEARTYASREHASLVHVLELYLAETTVTVEAASLAVAGPVLDGACQATNLPWRVLAEEIGERFGLARVHLLNDVEAAAWGALTLPPESLHTVAEGAAGSSGNACLIAPGSGLGQAGLYWDGRVHHPFAGEGGHSDFAPVNELEVELGRFLAGSHGRVSWEQVVSGPGLVDLHRFLVRYRQRRAPAWLEDEIELVGGRAITRAALGAADPVCVEAVELLLELLGREAGNLALKMLARGGVYIGGGIVPQLLPAMARGGFNRGFTAKGALASLLDEVPVWVILDPSVALTGAAQAFLARTQYDRS